MAIPQAETEEITYGMIPTIKRFHESPAQIRCIVWGRLAQGKQPAQHGMCVITGHTFYKKTHDGLTQRHVPAYPFMR